MWCLRFFYDGRLRCVMSPVCLPRLIRARDDISPRALELRGNISTLWKLCCVTQIRKFILKSNWCPSAQLFAVLFCLTIRSDIHSMSCFFATVCTKSPCCFLILWPRSWLTMGAVPMSFSHSDSSHWLKYCLFVAQFSLFGVCAFAFYSFYLLWACVAGNFKLGTCDCISTVVHTISYYRECNNRDMVVIWLFSYGTRAKHTTLFSAHPLHLPKS